MALIQGITRFGLGGAWRPYAGFVSASASAALTGTATDGVLESEIVAGGETIIITVANDTWVAAFDAQRQAIIDGLDSDGIEATGWNAEVRDKEVVTAVVRTSDTVVTITLSAAAAYSITADETITVTIPAAALTTSSIDVIATPTFDVTNEAPVAADEPRGSTRYDQRHRQYDFGEHYPGLRKEDKDRIDGIIDSLTPAAEKRLASGRPSKTLRKKIAQVLPEYAWHQPKPAAEYRAEAEAEMAAILQERTDRLMREDEEALLVVLMLAE